MRPESVITSRCLHHWFAAQAAERANAVAVAFEGQELTYAQLDRLANRLAHRLVRTGVRPDTLVALSCKRSPEMIVAILAILKAGGAYVPIEPGCPRERISFMLADSQPAVLIADNALPFPAERTILLGDGLVGEPEAAPDVRVDADNLAYVIYTSGSTGKPKGVLVTHRNVVRLFEQTRAWFRFDQRDVWTLFHSFAFDFSVWEIWGALLHGGRLVVVPFTTSRTPRDFMRLLRREGVTILNQTPSAFYQLIHAEEAGGEDGSLALRCVVLGGEALKMARLAPWFRRHGDRSPRVINMYGITETCVHATYRPLTQADLDKPSLIGEPIPDLRLHLLDEALQPVAEGEAGELCVAGAGVARGYLNRPELDGERFIVHAGQRFYRSGDLARRLPDGDLEYLGRIDDQVKIRGHRIELGEIESVLCRHASVRDSVVVARDERLIAYLLLEGPAPSASDLRAFAAAHLPDYMLPSLFLFPGSFPLTANGKVDRRALPQPEHARPGLQEPYRPPESRAERELARIWSEVLDVHPVGIDDGFFDLGGDSIRVLEVLALARQEGIQLSWAQVFESPTIRRLAQAAAAAAEPEEITPFGLITPGDRQRLPAGVEDAYPVTALQAGMGFQSELNPAAALFHDIFSYRIEFPFDAEKLEEAIGRLVERHEMLRTSFDFARYDQPLQLVHRSVRVSLGIEDLRALSRAAQQESLLAWIEAEKGRPFDWGSAPLVRFQAQCCGEREFQFLVSFHHLVLDGWSLAAIVAEIFHDYAGVVTGTPATLPSPRTRFRDFVALERTAVQSPACRQFWTETLRQAGRHPLPRWPKSPCRESAGQVRGPEVKIEPEIFNGLKRLAMTARVPLRTVLLAAYLRTVQWLTGSADVTCGDALNGRPERRDGERMIGLFLNIVPLRLNLAGGTWLDLVRQTYAAERALLPHRRFPLSEIRKHSGGQVPFEAAFNFVQWHIFRSLPERWGMGFREGPYYEANDFVLLLNVNLDITSSHLEFHYDYDPAQLADPQVRAMGDYYVHALGAMAAQPTARYETVSLLSASERNRILVDWNATGVRLPRNRFVHEIFEEQAAKTPDAVAVVSESTSLTYGELNQRADQLAAELRALGVRPCDFVGVGLDRSAGMIAAWLAVLKARAAYVPLDPSYPAERLAFMLQDCRARLLVDSTGARANLGAGGWQSSADGPANPDMPACLLYTSGSTGEPKGVVVSHRAILRLVTRTDYCRLTPADIVAQVSNASFDAATFEVWGALLSGARLVVVPQDVLMSPAEMESAIERHGITAMFVTTALFNQVSHAAPAAFRRLRHLLFGGEAVNPGCVARIVRAGKPERLLHLYGPTEATTFATWFEVTGEAGIVPIGRPVSNTQAYVLDPWYQPVPIGVAGDLYLAGPGLAEGYWNRPALTAENFIPHPFDDKGSRLYRTGDRACWLPDGNLLFLGRADNQVKVRGFRVEPGEIEAQLVRHPAIHEAAVAALEDAGGEKRLVAWIVTKSSPAPAVEDLWIFLRRSLPDYMIPATFVFLPAMPLDANGKVDRGALPAPGSGRPELRQPYTPPRTPAEETVANIWQGVLKVEPIGVHDNFFELGGHSLTAIQVIARVRNAFRVEMPLRDLFDHPTVAALAVRIETILSARNVERTPERAAASEPGVSVRSHLVDAFEPSPGS